MTSKEQIASTNPALLWIGPHDQLIKKTIDYLQQFFCDKKSCTTCTTCQQIKEQQHHAIMWLAPNPHYTLEDIAPLQHTLSFALDSEQHYFFVIQKADFLTPLCSNRLLKSIEEPPPGYHFIFLAERKEALLKTIQSRCVQTNWYEKDQQPRFHLIFDYFSTEDSHNPLEFIKDLQESRINEQTTVELINTLLHHWIKKYRETLEDAHHTELRPMESIINKLKEAALKAPMPGSSKLFWKNLFLHLN